MPHIDTFTTEQSVVIIVWQLTETLTQLLVLWGDLPLPDDIATIASEKRKCEVIATRLLLRHHYQRDIALHHHPNGAPYIDAGHISISHCSSHIAIALHPTQPVGVDIEILGERAIRTAGRFLSVGEYTALPDATAILADGTPIRSAAIHIAWSIKEAIYKIFPSAVEFRKDIITTPVITFPSGSTTVHLPTLSTTTTAHYTLYNGCSLAWSIQKM